MKIYNKGARAIIIKKSDSISGCRIPPDLVGKETAYIDPGTTVDIADNTAETLLKMYPKEIVAMETREQKIKKALKEVDRTKKKKAKSKKRG